MSKKCTPLRRECTKHLSVGTLLEVELSKKRTLESKCTQNTPSSEQILKLGCGFVWQAQGIVHLVKCESDVGFSSSCNNDGRHATFQEDLQRCISRGRRRTRDVFIRDVSRSGR